jgi:hypothetical protein
MACWFGVGHIWLMSPLPNIVSCRLLSLLHKKQEQSWPWGVGWANGPSLEVNLAAGHCWRDTHYIVHIILFIIYLLLCILFIYYFAHYIITIPQSCETGTNIDDDNGVGKASLGIGVCMVPCKAEILTSWLKSVIILWSGYSEIE